MKNLLAAFAAGALIAGITVSYIKPRIVTKTETVEKEVIRNNVQTVVRTITKPDGSKETVKTINDNSIRTADKSTLKEAYKQPNWNLGISAGTRLTDIDPVYALNVERRIVGPIFVGAYGRTDGEFGLSVSISF